MLATAIHAGSDAARVSFRSSYSCLDYLVIESPAPVWSSSSPVMAVGPRRGSRDLLEHRGREPYERFGLTATTHDRYVWYGSSG